MLLILTATVGPKRESILGLFQKGEVVLLADLLDFVLELVLVEGILRCRGVEATLLEDPRAGAGHDLAVALIGSGLGAVDSHGVDRRDLGAGLGSLPRAECPEHGLNLGQQSALARIVAPETLLQVTRTLSV